MPPKFFDTHCHLNFPDYYSDAERDACLARAREAGIWMTNVGSDLESSKRAVAIAEKYDEGVYAAVGLHPNDNVEEFFDVDKYRKLILHPKVVAIGECGLELHADSGRAKKRIPQRDIENQKNIFKEQIQLAIGCDKPLMVHCRNTHEEVLEILEAHKGRGLKGNIHFFSGTWEQAQRYLGFGFTLSFTGVITFARDYDETIKNAPLDKIMIETDAPFVLPEPYRSMARSGRGLPQPPPKEGGEGEASGNSIGGKDSRGNFGRNEPLYVVEVAKKIAEIRGISVEEVAEITTLSALKFIGK